VLPPAALVLAAACSDGGGGRSMSQLPQAGDLESLVIRTDFTDDARWHDAAQAIARPVTVPGAGTFQAMVKLVDDRRYDRLTIDRLLQLVPTGSEPFFLFLVDSLTLQHPDHPVLVVDLYHERGRFFRVIPSEMWGVQNNLIIANMDWEDFSEAVDSDGVFRGFPRPQ
jgi:hypothetical protein